MRIWRHGKFWILRGTFVGLVLSLALVVSALALSGTWREAGPGTAAAFPAESVATPTAAEPTARLVLEVTPVPATPTPTQTATATASNTPTLAPIATRPNPQNPALPASTAVPPTPVPPTATEPPPPPSIPSCPTAPLVGYAADLFSALNRERNAQGMSSLRSDGCAVYVAQIRSDDMARIGYFSHTSPTGESTFSLLEANGVPHGWAGENLARNNYPDEESVGIAVRDLMASEGHRANILNVNYTSIGVAVAFDGEGMKYFTMVYMGPP